MGMQLSGSLELTGSFTTSGAIVAQTLVVQTITSSITQMTGSNIFGSSLSNIQQLTGSVRITGSTSFYGNQTMVAAGGFPSTGRLLRASDNVLYDVAGRGGYALTDTGLNTMIYATSSYVQLSSNNSAVLTVTGSNIGIGTASPSQKLEVVGGEIKAGRVDSSQEGGQVSFGRASDNNTTWYIDAYGSSTSPQLRFVNVDNSVVAMTITGSNVGIGTSTPAGKLDISGGQYNTGLIVRTSSDNGTGLNLKNTDPSGGHDWYVISTGAGNGGGAGNLGFYDGTNGNYLFYIKGNNGNVGINTTNPGHKLEVNISGGNGSTAAIANLFGGANIANQNCYLYLGNTNVGMNATVDGAGTPRNNLYAFANGAGVVLNNGATAWSSNSDENVKDIIEPIINATDRISNFRTVVYKFKNEESARRLGLIAQDVEKEFPEIVSTNYSSHFGKEVKGVTYTELIPVLVKAIQELEARVKELENK